jgi:hypothetical protein
LATVRSPDFFYSRRHKYAKGTGGFDDSQKAQKHKEANATAFYLCEIRVLRGTTNELHLAEITDSPPIIIGRERNCQRLFPYFGLGIDKIPSAQHHFGWCGDSCWSDDL